MVTVLTAGASDSLELQMFTCANCGEDNVGRDTCKVCGHPSVADDEGFTIPLVFQVPHCPACGELSPAGPCIHCGAEVPEADTDTLAQARIKALGPLLDRAVVLRDSFENFPAPNVPVTAGQYRTTLGDAGLFDMCRRALELAHLAGTLDYSDERSIGGNTRKTLDSALDVLSSLKDETARIAWFHPPDPFGEVRELLISIGRQGADIAVLLLRVLAAGTVSDARAALHDFQGVLSDSAAFGRLSEVLDREPVSQSDDTDARIALALGIEGSFSDEFGFPDWGRVFSAFSGDDQPLVSLGRGASAYLSHLLPGTTGEGNHQAAVLALSAVPLATLDRPFIGHKIAQQSVLLLQAASARDEQLTRAALGYLPSRLRQTFATIERIRREVRLLANAEVASREEQVEAVVTMYKRLAEGLFRPACHVVLCLQEIVEGNGKPIAPDLLMLGDMEQRLTAKSDTLDGS